MKASTVITKKEELKIRLRRGHPYFNTLVSPPQAAAWANLYNAPPMTGHPMIRRVLASLRGLIRSTG